MSSSDWIAAASLGIALVALVVSWFGIWRANRTTSAATLVTLNEGFRQAWTRFFDAQDEPKKYYELAELLNLFEIACAVYLEKSLSGNARTLMSEYLENVLQHLVRNEYTKEQVGFLLQSATTFIFIRKFMDRKANPMLSVTIPPHWYETMAK
jgi:hypothetical protein